MRLPYRTGTRTDEGIGETLNQTKKPTVRRALLFFFAILMLVYLGYQGYKIGHSSVETEVARSVVVDDAVNTDIFVVRSEQYVTNKQEGTIISLISDGNRVSKGGGVAAVFDSDADAANYARINNLGAEVKRYKRLSSQNGSYAVNTGSMNKAVANDVINLAETIDDGDLEAAQEDVYTVRDRLITRQIAVGDSIDLNSKMETLNSQYSSLMQKNARHHSITASSSGYYISGSDGYENAVDYDKVLDLTVDGIKDLLKKDPEDVPDSVIGKICNDFDWYIVCIIPTNQSGFLSVGDPITVNLPSSAVTTVSAKVAAITPDQKKNKTALVLVSNSMNSYIASLRKESAEIVLATHEGLRINVDAVDTNDKGEQGVYIKEGNIARFRRLDVIYSTKKYVISKPHETGNYVSLYDEVIVGGNGLYDGKIV